MLGGRRVVITGLGAITPLGNSVQATWSNALAGHSGIGRITLFDVKDAPTQIAGEIKAFDPTCEFAPLYPRGPEQDPLTQASSPKDLRRLGRFIQLALVASIEAYQDSGLDTHRSNIAPERMAVNIGAGMGGLPEIQSVYDDFKERGYRRVTPFFIPQVISNLAAGQVSIALNLQGPSQCSVSACASSAHAIGESFRQIQRGESDIAIAGGAEAVVCEMGIAGFAAMRALSTRNDQPEKASRPFDAGRDGFVMGEGSGILILEEYEHARKRGAKIYAEVKGYGSSSDAFHITQPAPEGAGAARAMRLALRDAQISTAQVEYCNAHATSTPAGDEEEARAIASVFSADAAKLHVSSTKSMTGHLLGAAAAIEAVFSVLALRDQIIPPTINLENLDPNLRGLPMNFTPNVSVKKKLTHALSNSFGFGGTNASLIFGKE